MNNYKMDYAKKFHYIIKYLLLSVPLILIFYELILKLILTSDVELSISSSTTDTILSQIVDLTLIYGQDFSLITQNFVDFCTSGINSWYFDFLNAFGFNISFEIYQLMNVLLCIPIWILNVYVFDIVLDFLLLLPKLAHRLMNKLGGERYD